MKKSPAEKDAVYELPIEQQFVIIYKNVGIVLEHILVDKSAEDYNRVVEVAKAFADMYGECRINPIVDKHAKIGREKIFPNLGSDKANPDLYVKYLGYVEVKSPKEQLNSVSNANKASKLQNSFVCVTNHQMSISANQVESRTNSIWKEISYDKDMVFWFIDGTLIKYKRPKKPTL